MESVSSVPIPGRPPLSSAEKFFQGSLYLLLVTGFCALAGTGKLDLLSLAVAASALILRGYHVFQGKSVAIPERWATYLTVLYFAFYALDYFFLSQGFVSATVHMVLFITVVKIFSVQRERDLVYLAVLSFLMVLAAAVLTVDTLFLLTFGLFMLIAMATFISMEMRRSERAADAIAVSPRSERKFHRSLYWVALVLATFTLAGSTVIFFILPRMNMGGYLRSLGSQSDFVTGFSDSVNLGGIGRIQQSTAAVMHVQVLKGTMPGDVKWRGTALSKFDGRRWTNPPHDINVVYSLRNQPLDLSRLPSGVPLFSPAAHHSTLGYRVVMEPVGSYVFFLVSTPLKVNGPYPEVAISPEGAVYKSERGRGEGARTIDVYQGESDTTDPEPLVRHLDSQDYPAGIQRYLEPPPRLDARIPKLASEITASARTNYARARAIESYLRRNLGYTLELPGQEADPLANFLFLRKRGHCEYFASSMAVMLRTLGIPARVVNGFRGGEYNDLNHTYIIRGRDAHSWVEAYFPEYGWVTFDPTPSAAAVPTRQGWARVALYMDALQELWREWVVNYDFSHQVRLSTEIGTRTNALQSRFRSWYLRNYLEMVRRVKGLQEMKDIPSGNLVLAGSMALLVVAMPFAPRAWRALQRARVLKDPRQSPGSAASLWYMRLIKVIERRGIHKTPAQTPMEFALAIADPAVQKNVVEFTESYERARFAGSAEDAMRLPELFRKIAEARRRR
jgi:transglutaminase-like putative cysteine protease